MLSTGIARKQIVVKAVANTVLYTVPAGKTFIGQALPAGNIQISINGINVFTLYTGAYTPISLELVAGSTVACGATYTAWVLVGIEQ